MKKAIIMSAKYSPGHFSHMLAYYQLFKSIGISTLLYVNNGYESFFNDYPEYHKRFISKKDVIKADILLIYNMSVKDNKIIKSLMQTNPNIKILFVYHEPWLGMANWFNDLKSGKESFVDSIKTFGRYIFAKSILKSSDIILLPSKKAIEHYEHYCKRFNCNYTHFPLIFTDEANGETDIGKKEYFSFISTVQNSKNFDMFVKYIKFRANSDLTSKFQIATRTDISNYLDDDLIELIKRGRLIVNHGHDLTNQEINRAYEISNCTWMLYNRSTQSGVLCKSFMFGTPVIASDIGSFREFVDDKNGIILADEYSLQNINEAYSSILDNLEKKSHGAKDTFERLFFYKSYEKEFKEIIKGT